MVRVLSCHAGIWRVLITYVRYYLLLHIMPIFKRGRWKKCIWKAHTLLPWIAAVLHCSYWPWGLHRRHMVKCVTCKKHAAITPSWFSNTYFASSVFWTTCQMFTFPATSMPPNATSELYWALLGPMVLSYGGIWNRTEKLDEEDLWHILTCPF